MRLFLFFLIIVFFFIGIDFVRSRIFFRAIKKYGLKQGYELFSKFDDAEAFMPDGMRENLRREVLNDITYLERDL